MKSKSYFLINLFLLLCCGCSDKPEHNYHQRREIHFKDFAFTIPVGLRFFVTRDSLRGTISGGNIKLDISTMFMPPPVFSKPDSVLKSATNGSIKKKLVSYKLAGGFNNIQIVAWDTTSSDLFRRNIKSYYHIVMDGRQIHNNQMGKIIELFDSIKPDSINSSKKNRKKYNRSEEPTNAI